MMMKKTYWILLAIGMALMFGPAIGQAAAESKNLAAIHAAKNLACSACHENGFIPDDSEARENARCTTCHGSLERSPRRPKPTSIRTGPIWERSVAQPVIMDMLPPGLIVPIAIRLP